MSDLATLSNFSKMVSRCSRRVLEKNSFLDQTIFFRVKKLNDQILNVISKSQSKTFCVSVIKRVTNAIYFSKTGPK